MGRSARPKSTGTKPTASVAKRQSSSASTARAKRRFVVCLSNKGFGASLEARKIYRTLPDAAAKKLGLLRVVDESGGGYLYPAKRFEPIALSARLARALAR